MDARSTNRPDPKTVLGLTTSAPHAFLRRPVVWLALVLIAGAAIGAIFAVREPAPDRTFVTDRASKGNLEVIVTATGSVQPINKVDVSSELSGTVRSVLVDYNSKVVQGQPLAELDTDKLKATLESSRAKVTAAQAQLVEAKATVEEKLRDYQRKRALVERQVSSAQDVDAAKAAYDRAIAQRDSAAAQIGVAEADMRLNELNLSKACICSPIDGVVLKRNVDPGQTVASSFQAPILFSIAQDLTQMEIQVDVDEADVGQVREGQKAVFSVDAYPERKFDATLQMVRFASETVQGVVTYKAILVVDNKDELLRPGMTATADIIVERISDAILVPNAALRFVPPSQSTAPAEPGLLATLLRMRMPSFQSSVPKEVAGRRTVWTLRDGTPSPISVEIGPTDGKFTAIRGGAIAPGDVVIVDSVPAKR